MSKFVYKWENEKNKKKKVEEKRKLRHIFCVLHSIYIVYMYILLLIHF